MYTKKCLNSENIVFNISKIKILFQGNFSLAMMTILKDMENTALALNENTSAFFDVLMSSAKRRTRKDIRRYKADILSLEIIGTVSCLPGQVPNGEVCGKYKLIRVYCFLKTQF
jgi:hypothetical protein